VIEDSAPFFSPPISFWMSVRHAFCPLVPVMNYHGAFFRFFVDLTSPPPKSFAAGQINPLLSATFSSKEAILRILFDAALVLRFRVRLKFPMPSAGVASQFPAPVSFLRPPLLGVGDRCFLP